MKQDAKPARRSNVAELNPKSTPRGSARSPSGPSSRLQVGGTIIGFIIGVVVGLAAALAVAVYVTKVPVPFMSGKTLGRTADHDAAESRKNKDWDPNTPLYGKNPARPTAPAASAPVTAAASAPAAAAPPPADKQAKALVVTPQPVKVEGNADARPATSADPLGDLARAKAAAAPVAVAGPTAAPQADPFEYFVQAGAFRTPEDAEAQRAKLAMMGLEARVTEREQAGRTVFRVRMGPYSRKEDAERAKDRLDTTGAETALVRVQR
jgi:cell division protein FtsN